MSVTGINGAMGYGAYGARKTSNPVEEGSFSEQLKGTAKTVMQCVSAGGHKVSLFSDALMSYASPNTGESVNIYRADDYSEDNPLYLVKGLDARGNEFEQMIDASTINPNNCSYNEMMVLNLETGHTSPEDYIHSVALQDKAGVNSFMEQKNYIGFMLELADDYKTLGSWDSYFSVNEWMQNLLDYAMESSKWMLQ